MEGRGTLTAKVNNYLAETVLMFMKKMGWKWEVIFLGEENLCILLGRVGRDCEEGP